MSVSLEDDDDKNDEDKDNDIDEDDIVEDIKYVHTSKNDNHYGH